MAARQRKREAKPAPVEPEQAASEPSRRQYQRLILFEGRVPTMNEIMSINPDDARLTRQLVYESQAATAAYESTRIRNICLGTGAVVLAAGIGLAALVWAWNQGVDPEALKQALADMPPIKVEATLDPNAKVKMADGKIVLRQTAALASSASIRTPPSRLPVRLLRATMPRCKDSSGNPEAAEGRWQSHQAQGHRVRFGGLRGRQCSDWLGTRRRRCRQAFGTVLLLPGQSIVSSDLAPGRKGTAGQQPETASLQRSTHNANGGTDHRNDQGARLRAAEVRLAARDWRRRISVEGRLDDVAERLSRDYDPALTRKTG